MTRNGLADLEAGYAVNQLHAHVGDQLRAAHAAEHEPAAQALAGGPQPFHARFAAGPGDRTRRERSWVARLPARLAGQSPPDPDRRPLAFFRGERVRRARPDAGRLPADIANPALAAAGVSLEGSRSTPVRTRQTTPLATTIGPTRRATPSTGSWPSTARAEWVGEEFDLEQTADVWLFVDLEHPARVGSNSTIEVSAVAAIAESGRSPRPLGSPRHGRRADHAPVAPTGARASARRS